MLDSTIFQVDCPSCGQAFIPARSNQKHCTRACQKNSARGPRTVADSAGERRRQEARAGRLQGLSNAFFETPPSFRAAFLVALIAEARANSELREWVTQREFLGGWRHHKGTGRLPIAHCLDHFCQEVYGLRSFKLLDPETRLPTEDEVAFPVAYFEAGQPPLYEDGSLKQRAHAVGTHRQVPSSFPTKLAPLGYEWRKIGRAMKDHGWQRYIEPKFSDEDTPAYDFLPQQP